MHWVLIVTFAVGNPAFRSMEYTNLAHAHHLKDEVVRDKLGRVVVFDDIATCKKVAVEVVDKMLMNTSVRPLDARCVPAKVSK